MLKGNEEHLVVRTRTAHTGKDDAVQKISIDALTSIVFGYKELEKIEEDIISRERSKLRDRLLQSHRYFTSPEKNPLHAWSEMEADAFWSMFKEYENAKGNGHMHTVVQPEMRASEVIPMHEDAKIAELMGSRK